MTTERRDELIDKYHRQIISDSEMAELNQWLIADDIAEVPVPEYQLKRSIFNSVQSRIATEERSRLLNRNRTWRRVAASFILLAGAGYASYHFQDPIRDFVDPVVYLEQQAGPGSVLSLTLADGSVVQLNAASKIRYPKKFNRHTREIVLEGEAFFKVSKDAQKPFVVHASGLDVRVLGTSFNVKNYINEKELTVTLAEGSVEVQKTGVGKTPAASLTRLRPAEQLVYERSTASFVKRSVDAAVYSSWTSGELKFVHATVQEIVFALERRYGVSIQLSGEGLRNCRFTTSFGKISVSQALEILGMMSNTTYTIHGNTINLKGDGCAVKIK